MFKLEELLDKWIDARAALARAQQAVEDAKEEQRRAVEDASKLGNLIELLIPKGKSIVRRGLTIIAQYDEKAGSRLTCWPVADDAEIGLTEDAAPDF